eukprot:15364393-Ditylum_brightwellii.AAC.2
MSSALDQAASYYLLYKTDPELQIQAHKQPPEKTQAQAKSLHHQTSKTNSSNTEEDSNAFWQEFEWTPKQKSTVEKALAKNLVKSSIHSNLSSRGKFLVDKLDLEANLNWDKFYTSHQTKFFKDRHYLNKAFPDEFGVVYGHDNACGEGEQMGEDKESSTSNNRIDIDAVNLYHATVSPFTIVEIGCGVVAVDLLQQDTRYIEAQKDHRACSAVWDITESHPSEIHPELESCSDISLLLFCLSAVSPDKMQEAANHVAATLKPGGTLILRDYGRFDEAQLKLGSSKGKRLSENFYVKHDSTRVYYFDLDDLERLFGSSGAGLVSIEKKYIQRVYKSRSDNTERRRVWVQARFRKPL